MGGGAQSRAELQPPPPESRAFAARNSAADPLPAWGSYFKAAPQTEGVFLRVLSFKLT